jgi:predicted RNase H-like HicB family nuclease
MLREFTLEYWMDDGWYVGRLREVPGVVSQGESLGELEENVREAHHLMREDEEPLHITGVQKKTPIPRHSEIKETLAELIRKQLGIN